VIDGPFLGDGQTKISDFDFVVLCQKDVGRFQIPMNDFFIVNVS